MMTRAMILCLNIYYLPDFVLNLIHIHLLNSCDRSRIMIIDYPKLNQMVTPIPVAVSDVISLLSKLTHPLVPGVQLLI